VAEVRSTAVASRTASLFARMPRPSFPNVAFATLIAVPTAISLVLRAMSPVWLQAIYVLDSELFGQLGANIADNTWLGPFDGRNLVKGPSYPMFIALSYWAHIPLVMAEQLLYLLAAAVAATALGRVGRSRWLGGSVFAVLALNPVHLGAYGSSVAREVVYASFSLLLLGSVLLAVSFVPRLAYTRRGWGYLLLVGGGAVIGFVGAAYYLCREERAWIAPAVLLAAGAGLWSWRGTGRPAGLRAWAGVLIVITVAAGCGCATVNAVVQKNKETYGAAVISDVADGQLARAYSDWQSVEVGPRHRWIPVSRAARLAVYEFSPAAAELQPYLEGAPKGSAGCRSPGCEYSGAMFIWAMRDAIRLAGHLRTETDLQGFSRRMAGEIEAACHAHELRCNRSVAGLIPPMTSADIGPIVDSGVNTVDYLLTFDAASPRRIEPSGGSDWAWRQMTRAIPVTSDQARYRAAERAATSRQGPVSTLGNIYGWLAIPALVVALCGVIWALVRPRYNRALAFAVMAVLAALLARIAVIALVDALAYSASNNPQYAIPGTDLLVLFTAVGCWVFGVQLVGVVAARRGPYASALGSDADVDHSNGLAVGGHPADGDDRLPERRMEPSFEGPGDRDHDAVPDPDGQPVPWGHP
jgi:hypothetical protein